MKECKAFTLIQCKMQRNA